MRRLLFILTFLCLAAIQVQAQVFVGLRDSRFAYAGYKFTKGWQVSVEYSIFSEKLGFQKIRLYGAYTHQWERAAIEVEPYASTLWNGDYQDYGILVSGSIHPVKIWSIDGTLNPHEDSEVGYTTCYRVGTSVDVSKHISLLLHYQNIPEYRLPEKRIRVGAKFTSGKLSATPEISLPTKEIKNLRVAFGMEYQF